VSRNFWLLFVLSLLLYGISSLLSWRVEKWTDDWKSRGKK
jgi:hypothetical protein